MGAILRSCWGLRPFSGADAGSGEGRIRRDYKGAGYEIGFAITEYEETFTGRAGRPGCAGEDLSPRELSAWLFFAGRRRIAATRDDINVVTLGSRGKKDALKEQIAKLDDQL